MANERPIQLFSAEYLQQCEKLSADEIAEFLENYRLLAAQVSTRSKLISIKIPENLLSAFKTKAKLEGVPYQTKIKELMAAWLTNEKPKE